MKRINRLIITFMLCFSMVALFGCGLNPSDKPSDDPSDVYGPEMDLSTVIYVQNDELRQALLKEAGKPTDGTLFYGDFIKKNAIYLSNIDDISELQNFYFPSLTAIGLTNCHIKEIPLWLLALRNLRVLDLSYNEITEIPKLYGLGNLTYVDLSHNGISSLQGVPAGNLEWVDLSYNQISEIPDGITEFTRLISVDLSYNQINVLPDAFLLMPALITLDVRGNILTYVPEGISEAIPDFRQD